MLKKNPNSDVQEDLFRPRLENFINMKDAWVQLAHLMDWSALEKDLSSCYCLDNGGPGESIRVMVGLSIIKDKEGLSNEQLCNRWARDPYLQYFCGEDYF